MNLRKLPTHIPLLITSLTGRINVGMEDGRIKAAFRRRHRIIVFEDHPKLESPSFPNTPLSTGYHTFPLGEVQRLWGWQNDICNATSEVFLIFRVTVGSYMLNRYRKFSHHEDEFSIIRAFQDESKWFTTHFQIAYSKLHRSLQKKIRTDHLYYVYCCFAKNCNM